MLVNPAPSQLKEAISSYDALLVSDGTVVDAETIAAGRQLKVIGRVGMGADNIDIAKATSQGILVLDAPEGYVISEVEHTMLLMLELARHVSFSNKNLIDDKLQEGKFKGVELYKKILGLIGCPPTTKFLQGQSFWYECNGL